MSRTAWAYVAGGAGDGRTMRHNREAFERWRIVPRMLQGVTQRDLTVALVPDQVTQMRDVGSADC
jgi:lactate 2-monooxygenase